MIDPADAAVISPTVSLPKTHAISGALTTVTAAHPTPVSSVAQKTVAATSSTRSWRCTSALDIPPSAKVSRNVHNTVPAANQPTSSGESRRARMRVWTNTTNCVKTSTPVEMAAPRRNVFDSELGADPSDAATSDPDGELTSNIPCSRTGLLPAGVCTYSARRARRRARGPGTAPALRDTQEDRGHNDARTAALPLWSHATAPVPRLAQWREPMHRTSIGRCARWRVRGPASTGAVRAFARRS